MKRFNGNNYVERTVIKAIQHDIALYAIHTNLDNVTGGVNSKIASLLSLQNQAILEPKSNLLYKLVVYVPRSHVESVREALLKQVPVRLGLNMINVALTLLVMVHSDLWKMHNPPLVK